MGKSRVNGFIYGKTNKGISMLNLNKTWLNKSSKRISQLAKLRRRWCASYKSWSVRGSRKWY